MDKSSNDYHISFFKPTTPQAVANRNMVVWLVLIWFFAIFGFHILLRVVEKPTPEPSFETFQAVWVNVESGTANESELQEFGKSTLSVLGKIAIAPQDKLVLNNALSWSVYNLVIDTLRSDFVSEIARFEEIRAGIENISDPDYIEAKVALSAEISPVLNLSSMDIRSKILPLELSSKAMSGFSDEAKAALPGIMKKYLVHNQSFLTDAKFLGFPFHYFYSAVFLLVLFVGLCLGYCLRTDALNAKFNIID